MAIAEQLVYFRQQAAEFNNLSDAAVTAWINSAIVFLDSYIPSISTNKLDMALALYGAHLAWLSKYPGQGGASRGPITEEKDDKRSKKYQLIQNSDTWLQQSLYGQSFANLTGIGGAKRAAILTRYGILNNEFS